MPSPFVLDVDAFLARFPEFRTAGLLIEQALQDAVRQCDANVWGALHEQAVHYLAADWLSNHPNGRSQRSEEKEKPSRYRLMYDEIFKKVAIRSMVT